MFFVLEIQRFNTEQASLVTPVYSNTNYDNAVSEFHRLCSVAAVSSLPRHTIILLDDSGYFYDIKCFEHLQ